MKQRLREQEERFFALHEDVAVLTEQVKHQSKEIKEQQLLIKKQTEHVDILKDDMLNMKKEIINAIKELYGDPVLQYHSLKKKWWDILWDIVKKVLFAILSLAVIGASYTMATKQAEMQAQIREIQVMQDES